MRSDLRPSTFFMLFAQYGGKAVIPVEDICRDYFSHLTPDKFMRKIGTGDIRIPVTQMEGSQKSHKGVHINDLADYIDQRRNSAVTDFNKLFS